MKMSEFIDQIAKDMDYFDVLATIAILAVSSIFPLTMIAIILAIILETK